MYQHKTDKCKNDFRIFNHYESQRQRQAYYPGYEIYFQLTVDIPDFKE